MINGATRSPDVGEIITSFGNTCEVVAVTPTFTNVNGWQIDHARISGCGIAVDCHGRDSNVGIGRGIDVSDCGYGILDGTFLGATWIGCEVEHCRSAHYSVTAPASASLFLGCYTEAEQPNCDFSAGASLILGGQWVLPFTGTAYRSNIQGTDNRVVSIGRISGSDVIETTSYFQTNASGRRGASALFLYGAESGAVQAATDTLKLQSGMLDGAAAVAVSSDTSRDFTTAGAKIHSFMNNGVEKAYVDKDGGLVVSGTLQAKSFLKMSDYSDGSGTAGNQTLNVSHGKAKIASGQQTCAITSDRLISGSMVLVTLETDDATAILKNVTRLGTTFTVKLTANCMADTVFGFVIVIP